MFAIKNRPLRYSDVEGQEVPKKMLINLRARGNYPKALVLPGPSGIGKTTLARIFSRAILCDNLQEDGSPCNECSSCRQHIRDAHPNFLEVDAASHSGKEDMENLKLKLSYESEGTVIILLDESHNISRSGNDALLKVLESSGVNDFMVIFCTTKPFSMPEALAGRSITIPVRAPSDDKVAKRLAVVCEKEGLNFEPGALQMIADASAGNVRKSEQVLEGVSLLGSISLQNCRDAAVLDLDLISKGIQALGRNLDESLTLFEQASATFGVEAVYKGILRLLVDAAWFGASLEKRQVSKAAKEIWHLIPKKVPTLIDYIVSREVLTDLCLLRSDLVVMHARYLKGEILDSEISTTSDPGLSASKVESSKKTTESEDSWETLERVRKQKRLEREAKLGGAGSSFDDGPTLDWPAETTNAKPSSLKRS
jgi:DNA polymerase III subunit gamma/tau